MGRKCVFPIILILVSFFVLGFEKGFQIFTLCDNDSPFKTSFFCDRRFAENENAVDDGENFDKNEHGDDEELKEKDEQKEKDELVNNENVDGEETEKLSNMVSLNGNVIYLTFDDGPSRYTEKLLDILKKYNVKATFFVTGKGSDEMILREYQEGHAIGLHSNSHDYSYIYKNVDNYFSDLNAIQERVFRITGERSWLIRFPGGSSNTVSRKHDDGKRIMSTLVSEVGKKGYTYFDWNVSAGDAGNTTTAEQVYQNVISSLRNGESIVLQHDSQGFSVDAVEQIIQYGQSQGYKFEKLNSSSFAAHHGVNN